MKTLTSCLCTFPVKPTLLVLLVGALTGCAVPAPNEVVRQCVAFETDKHVGVVYDAGFDYGQAMAMNGMTVASIGTGVFCISVPVPDKFEVTWRTSDGRVHIASVPVRERLIRRPKPSLDLIFVFTEEGIEGYIKDSYLERRLFVRQREKSNLSSL